MLPTEKYLKQNHSLQFPLWSFSNARADLKYRKHSVALSFNSNLYIPNQTQTQIHLFDQIITVYFD